MKQSKMVRCVIGVGVATLALVTAFTGQGFIPWVDDQPHPQVPHEVTAVDRMADDPAPVAVLDAVMQPTTVTRVDDGAPWHSGGAIASPDGVDYCTTGFSVVTGTGHHRMVGAAHCGDGVGSLVHNGAGQRLGVVTHTASRLDAHLIDPFGSPETTGAVFGGPWNASSQHLRYQFPVVGVAQPTVGQMVCSSGAVTGEHCGATIRATDVAWTCGNEVCHGFRARREDGGVMVGGGDSGGPMYTVRDGQVYAIGMIDGGSEHRSCDTTSVPTQCFSTVYGIPMTDILAHWHAKIDSSVTTR